MKDAAADAATDYALQKDFAAASQSRVERRDPNAVYQLNTLATLEQRAPGMDWKAFFAALGVEQPREFNVASPGFVAAVARAAADAPLATWRAYLTMRVLDELAPVLPAEWVTARFRVSRHGHPGAPAERVTARAGDSRDHRPVRLRAAGRRVSGELYVARAFTPEAKARALQMIADIKAAMRARIERLDWMSAPTKQRALQKLDAMALKIGYPDQWKSYRGLVIENDDYAGNWLRARAWFFDLRLGDLGKPVDRARWFISPSLVNAFAGALNEIVFPAAILQPPFFYPTADDAVNYGGIGAVIGHEITHHFDDRGRQFDSVGNLNDWWTADDAAAYKARAARLAQQYSGFSPLPGQTINGQLTLGENISDLGGVEVAYEGLQIALARKPVGLIDGLTPDQRFFISFATIWRGQYRNESLLDTLRTDYAFAGAVSPDGDTAQRAGVRQGIRMPGRLADDARAGRSDHRLVGVGWLTSGSRHRLAVLEPQPAACDAVDRPDAEQAETDDPDRESDQHDREHRADDEDDDRPQHRPPERADLPREVRVEPGPAHLAAFHIVDDDRDDRRPAEEKRSDHRRGAECADDEAERVQRVDDVCRRHQRIGRRGDGRGRAHRRLRCRWERAA